MTKTTRARFTLEFKEEAVRLVKGGKRQATEAKNLGLHSDQRRLAVSGRRHRCLLPSTHRLGDERRMPRQLIIDALTIAWFRRQPDKGLLCHSDRGSQYASADFQKLLKRYGMRGSMSRKGNCWDNAVTETLFGLLKVERLHGVQFETRRAAKDEVVDWLVFYNRKRLHSTLGYKNPMGLKKFGIVSNRQRRHNPRAMGGAARGQGQTHHFDRGKGADLERKSMGKSPPDTLSAKLRVALDATEWHIDAVARRGPVFRLFSDMFHNYKIDQFRKQNRYQEENQ